VKRSPPGEANSHSASHDISQPLWKPKVYYRVHKSSPPVPNLTATCIHSTSFHNISLRSILILSSHLRLGLSSGLLHSGFPTKCCTYTSCPMCAVCTAHIIVLYLITPTITTTTTTTIIGEAYNLWSSSLCNVLQLPSTSSLLDRNILLSSLFSSTLNLCPSINVRFVSDKW